MVVGLGRHYTRSPDMRQGVTGLRARTGAWKRPLGEEGINEAEGLDGFWGLFLPPLLLPPLERLGLPC